MKDYSDFGIYLHGKSGVEVKIPCPQCSPHRKKKNYPCLNVNTEKAVWHCWHCNFSGALKTGVDNRSNPFAWKPKTYTRPTYQPLTTLPAKIIDWFGERGITDTVLARNKISYGPVYMPQIEEEVNAVQFPFVVGGEVVNIKYRDGKKNFRMVGGAERVLYGLDDLAETTVIVEGEMDKLSLEMAGFRNCISIPDGAPAEDSKNYESKFDFLEAAKVSLATVKNFILAVDGDGPGKRLEEELARRLGREKCCRVQWPDGCKDANDVLLLDGAQGLADVINAARPYPVKGIFDVIDISDKVETLYRDGVKRGELTGWRSLDELYSVRPGEWTLVTGIPGHGKSELVDALMVNLALSAGWTFGVCSPENQPLERHVAKLAEKLINKPFSPGPTERMTRQEMDAAKDILDQHFSFILPEEDNLTVDGVLELARVLVFRKGIKGLVIDPWNELDHTRPPGTSETEYISRCLTRVRQFARTYGVHVWLVAHPTKLFKDKEGNYPVPTPYDVSGSAHWRNKADNALTVWRDMEDPRKAVEVHVQKIRFKEIGKVGIAELMYRTVTGRYVDPETAYGYKEIRG